jgi:hypothetical protein
MKGPLNRGGAYIKWNGPMAHYIVVSSLCQVFCSANKQQQRLYGMYDVISVLLFILYTGLENLIIDESCKTCKSRS